MISRSSKSWRGLSSPAWALLAAFALAGCGGGGGGDADMGPQLPDAPSALSYDSPQTYAVGVAIETLEPVVTGTVDSYSVSPALPAGLALDQATGELSGTPTESAGEATYTITAENTGGSTDFAMTLAVEPPAIEVLSGHVSRMVVQGTSVFVDVLVHLNFPVAGVSAIQAVDPTGTFRQAVSTAPASDGNHVLTLQTVSTAVAGVHAGDVTFELCSDDACSEPESVIASAVPFDVDVLASGDPWPGNHLTTLSPWAGTSNWSMYQGDAAHTGFVAARPDPDQVSTRWTIPAIPATGGGYTPHRGLAVEAGRFFVAGGNFLYARSEHDASIIWQYDFSGLDFPSVNPPAVKDGVVYIAAGQQGSTYMFSFAASDGTLGFKSAMSSQWENYLAPTIGAGGVYTNAGTYGGMYAFDFSGQQLYFASSLAQTSMWTPAIDAFGVYTYTGGQLQVFDPVNGATLQVIQDPTFENYIYEIGGSPVLGAHRNVFVANYANSILNGGAIGNTLSAFDLDSNTIAWQIPGVYPSTPAYHAGVLYVANENPVRLEARAEEDGALIWSWTPPQGGDTNFASEVLLTESLVLVSTNLATYAIDLASHHPVWSYPMPGRLALSNNGVLYIQGDVSTVALNLK